jgi:hypothetical protein
LKGVLAERKQFQALTHPFVKGLTRLTALTTGEQKIYDFSVDSGARGQNALVDDPTKDEAHPIGALWFYEPSDPEWARILQAYDDNETGDAAALRVTPGGPLLNPNTFDGDENVQIVILDPRSQLTFSNRIHIFYRHKGRADERTVVFMPAELANQ